MNKTQGVGRKNRFFDRISSQLAMLGMPAPWLPRDIQVGPFQAVGAVPDNTTAPIDLTQAVAWQEDRNFTQLLGANNNDPRVILYIAGVRMHLNYAGETDGAVVQQAYRSRLYMEHQASGDVQRIYSLSDALVDTRSGVAVATTAAATTLTPTVASHEVYQPLPYPWIVDLSVDQFTVQPSAPTNIAAAGGTPFVLSFYGCAFQSQSISADDFRDICDQIGKPKDVIAAAILNRQIGRRS